MKRAKAAGVASAVNAAARRHAVEMLEPRVFLAAHIVGSSTVYSTIQAAVTAASAGAVITVDAGTYPELVTINKSLTLRGAQSGVDARTNARQGGIGESVVTGTSESDGQSSGFYIAANDVTIDGFTVEGNTSDAKYGAGIVIAPNQAGMHIINNIIEDNVSGLYLSNNSSTDAALIQYNVFARNNNNGANGGRGIYTDNTVSGGVLTNVTIDSNFFFQNYGGSGTSDVEAGVSLESRSTSANSQTNITISNNTFDNNGKAVLAYNASNLTIKGNTVTDSIDQDSGSLRFEGGDSNVLIENNNVFDNLAPAVRIDSKGFSASDSGFTLTSNNFYGNGYVDIASPPNGLQVGSVIVGAGQYTGTLNAANNWWGDPSGPSGDGPGTGDVLVGNGVVTFSPWNTTPAIGRESAFTGLAQVPNSQIQAVTFDQGGANLGYQVGGTVDASMAYRQTAVQTETTADPGSEYDQGYDVTGLEGGQWLAYSVNIPVSGTYRLDFRVASGAGGGTFHAMLDGMTVGGELTVPNTGGNQVWQTISSANFSAVAGAHTVTVLVDTNGGDGTVGNLHWLQLTAISSNPVTYLSTLNWVSATTGYGSIMLNQSVNGNPITLRGTVYPSGIGTHAVSQIVYDLGGMYTNFTSDIGVDDEEAGSTASLIFQVLGDSNVVLYTSPTLTPSSAVVHVNVNVVGVQQLTLVVNNGVSGIDYDHADWAGAILVQGVPAAPTGLQAYGTPSQVSLSWNASLGATSYNVYRGTSPGGESGTPIATNVSGTTYSDTTGAAGTVYYYKVAAVDPAGASATSNEASTKAGVAQAPAVPVQVQAVGGIAQIALSWQAMLGAASYNIYRGTSAGAEGSTAYKNVTTASFVDTGLTSGSVYYYKVTSVNAAGESAKSAEETAAVIQQPAHIIIVVEENEDADDIFGSPDAPFLNSLAAGGAYFSNYHAITHPSQPNYIALFSGSTQGVTDDTAPSSQFNVANMGSQLIAAGLSFTGYAEGLPSVGSLAVTAGAIDADGNPLYARKHNPWSDFSNLPSADNQPFTSFPTNFNQLPTVSWVIPNLEDDMHDGTVNQADTWLQTNLGAYAAWAKANNSLLIVTWDEDETGDNVNLIPTIIYGQQVNPGTYSENTGHYGLLRTIEDLYGLTDLGGAATAAPIIDIWNSPIQLPPGPSNLTATPAATQVTLNWQAASGATSYNVYRSSSSGGEGTTPYASGVAMNQYVDNSVTPGATYYYQVTAVTSAGEGLHSGEISTTTLKATSTFTGLTASSSLTYGTSTVTLGGTLAAGTLIPPGNVVITINGVGANAAINASTGAFSASVDPHLLSASATAYTVTYSYAGNAGYNTASDATHTLTITPRALNVTATGINRVYDGTTIATVTLLDNRVNSDVLTLTYGSAVFADKKVATGKTVTVTGITLSGTAASNYALANTSTTTAANITAVAVSGSITAANKVYDSTTAATLATRTLTGMLGTDAVTLTGGTATFDTENIGAGKTVTATGLTLTGTDAGNYTLSNPTETTTASITPQEVINGTSGIDDLRLTADANPGFVDWFVFVGGNPTQFGEISATDPAGLTINGLGGNDTILLNYANGNPLPGVLHLNGTFTLNGLSGANPLAGTNLEIGQSTLYVSYATGSSPATLIQQALAAGYNGGTWAGTPTVSTGVITSVPAAAAPTVFGIGYADSADGVVAGQPANTVEIRYTVMGDANLDRVVNLSDATRLQANWSAAGSPAWDRGNFDYDATIGLNDALLMTRNWNATATGSVAAADLPAVAPATSPDSTTPSTTSSSTSSSTDAAAVTPTDTAPATTPVSTPTATEPAPQVTASTTVPSTTETAPAVTNSPMTTTVSLSPSPPATSSVPAPAATTTPAALPVIATGSTVPPVPTLPGTSGAGIPAVAPAQASAIRAANAPVAPTAAAESAPAAPSEFVSGPASLSPPNSGTNPNKHSAKKPGAMPKVVSIPPVRQQGKRMRSPQGSYERDEQLLDRPTQTSPAHSPRPLGAPGRA